VSHCSSSLSSRLSKSPESEELCPEWAECKDELEGSDTPEDGEEIDEPEREEGDGDESESSEQAGGSELGRSSRNSVTKRRVRARFRWAWWVATSLSIRVRFDSTGI
jgi:hypothetical protein